MKRSLLALAVLGAFAGTVSAQSSVTLSGIVDAGVIRGQNAVGTNYSVGGSQSGYNAITFSGKEDLGGGMNAFFAANHRFRINDGSINSTTNPQQVFWRNVWVGLGGGFGDVRAGRMLMPLQDMNGGFDPFATGTVGSTHVGGINATIRANNTVYYRSPSLGGLSFHAAVAAGEGQSTGEVGGGQKYTIGARSINTERPIGFNVRYAAGPINVGVGYDKNGADLKTVGFYGSYDLGVAKLFAQFEKGDNCLAAASVCTTTANGAEDLKVFSFGATAPLGPVLLRAGILKVSSDLTNRDGTKVGFGGDYNLSKRTNLYATLGKSSGNRYNASSAANGNYERKAVFDLGVTHRF